MGPPAFTGQFTQRLILPDLRVGDYTLDNHPVASPGGYQARVVALEDDEFALRHALWRQLDGAYKAASADFLRKQALQVNRGKTDYDTDDLTREQPRGRKAQRPENVWKTSELAKLCAEPGKTLRQMPGLLGAETTVRLRRQWSRLRDSEGSAVDSGREVAEVEIEATDIAADGMKLSAARRFVTADPSALPSVAVIMKAARDMAEDLRLLKLAQSTSPFSAPALLDSSVAAVVVLSIGLRLSGDEQRNPAGAQTFRGKLGKPVLPDDFTLIDDPTQKEFDGRLLAGHYEFDDQGVAPQRVALIERGILKNILLSRYPVVGMLKSMDTAAGPVTLEAGWLAF